MVSMEQLIESLGKESNEEEMHGCIQAKSARLLKPPKGSARALIESKASCAP